MTDLYAKIYENKVYLVTVFGFIIFDNGEVDFEWNSEKKLQHAKKGDTFPLKEVFAIIETLTKAKRDQVYYHLTKFGDSDIRNYVVMHVNCDDELVMWDNEKFKVAHIKKSVYKGKKIKSELRDLGAVKSDSGVTPVKADTVKADTAVVAPAVNSDLVISYLGQTLTIDDNFIKQLDMTVKFPTAQAKTNMISALKQLSAGTATIYSLFGTGGAGFKKRVFAYADKLGDWANVKIKG